MKTKKQKATKSILKGKQNYQDYKNFLETAQIENKINHLEKNKFNVDSLEDQKEFIRNNKLILKTQERFKSERHNVYTEEIIKVAWSLNDDKRMQSIFSIETYTYGMNKDLVCKKEEIKWNSIIKECLLTKEDIEKHNLNWPEISDHPYIVLIVGGSISEKTNALLNLINQESDIDQIYSYAKDPYEAKYQLEINKRESAGLKYLNDSKTFIEYSNDMNDIYKNIEEYNPNKKRNTLIIFLDMDADNPVVTGLFTRE